MFPARACDDVAVPHVSPGLTTTSGKTKQTSGRERGGERREGGGVKGRGLEEPPDACALRHALFVDIKFGIIPIAEVR